MSVAESVFPQGTLLPNIRSPGPNEAHCSTGRHNFMLFYHSTYSILKTWVEVSQWSDYPTGESSKEALQRTLVSDSPACNADAARGGAFEHWYNVMTAGELEIIEMALSKSQFRRPLPTAPAQREAFFRACMAQILWWGNMATPAGIPDFRANSSSCTDTPPVLLAVLDIILGNQAFYRRKGRPLADGDGRIDRQTDGKMSGLYRFTDTDRMNDC
jgi:hypothetical protein